MGYRVHHHEIRLTGHVITELDLGDGRDEASRLIRLSASDTDRLRRDRLVGWITEAGLVVAVDRIGNIFGIWAPPDIDNATTPLMLGSHIDTVINAGIFDGC